MGTSDINGTKINNENDDIIRNESAKKKKISFKDALLKNSV